MATVRGLTAERMLEIEAASVVAGAVDLRDHLILTKHDGTTIDAGYIKGDPGTPGEQGPPGPVSWSNIPDVPLSLPPLPPNSLNVASPATDFPPGSSVVLVDPHASAPVPSFYGTLTTYRGTTTAQGAHGVIQYWHPYQDVADAVYYRLWYYQATKWSMWFPLSTPAGVIEEYAGTTAPPGYLLANGQAVSRTGYPRLYAACSTRFGGGDGSTTFNVPNRKGRVGVGLDSAQTEFNTLGKTGGAKTHTLGANEMPPHNHDFAGQTILWGAEGTVHLQGNLQAEGGPSTANGVFTYQNVDGWTNTYITGGGAAHNNIQPYVTVNYIIHI